MSERIYHFKTDAQPELMDMSSLSEAFESLSGKMSGALRDFLDQPGSAAETLGSLSREPLWYTKAALLSLEDTLCSQSPELRDTCLSHLFDMMFFGNRSVRSIAARTAGRMIARCMETDMSVWTDFLRKALFMKKDDTLTSQKLTEDPLQKTFHMIYRTCREDLRKPMLAAYASYFKSTRWDTWTCLRLISGIILIPVKEWGAMQRGNIGGFIRYFLKKSDAEIRVASFCLLNEWLEQGWRPSDDFRDYLAQSISYIYDNEEQISPAENELIRIVCAQAGIERKTLPAPADKVLYLNNLRSNHFWLYKLVNLRMLRGKYGDADKMAYGFDTYVTHLLTLLRLNPDEIVFRRAGEDLLNIEEKLSDRQKYETVRELFKVIETGYDATGYIPEFLGRFYLKMNSQIQSELLPDIEELCNSRDPETVGNAIETACCIVAALSDLPHTDERFRIIRKLCGLINQSLYSDMDGTARHVLFSAGCELFGALGSPSAETTAENECFAELARNAIISLMDQGADLLCHTESVRNISEWMTGYCASGMENSRPVAFYSGSFDPFTNGHHAIVREIADMGFQVYVYVHDFAPGRNVQPLLIRRKIAAMSVTDLPHVQLFPEDISVNIENPSDLERLQGLFPGRKVWLVAGSYRIEENEVYAQEPSEGSVHHFPHIVFMRNETHGYYDESDVRQLLKGELITLKLPSYYEHMTSGEIRQNIQDGKSIEGLVGNQIQNFISRHKLYGSNVAFKPDVPEMQIVTETGDGSCSIYLMEDGQKNSAGCVLWHRDGERTVLERAEGDLPEILLDETLLALQARYKGTLVCPEGLFDEDLLIPRGFLKSEDGFTVSMDEPVVLFQDTSLCISDSFRDDERLAEAFRENTRNLQKATALLYPGNLVLKVTTEVMNYRLNGKIHEHCSSDDPYGKGRICVPFGKILKGYSIPGVTIMPLHTEKVYEPDMSSFTVCEKAGYPALQTQMRNIRSMNRPFILVDDLFHKGYRMNKISRNLADEGMKEDCVIVGVCSDAGRNLAETSGYNVDSVYDIPSLRHWIIESDMIPFFAGDKVYGADRRTEEIPSIYPILPYQYPSFLKDSSYDAVYALSCACMENAIRLYDTLETIYKEKNHRSLSLAHLGEVIFESGAPEKFAGREDIQGCLPSELLKGELICLKRLNGR